MVLTKEELSRALRNEVRLLLHLASKIEPAQLDYRPSARQRSLLELVQYLAIMAPIHARAVMADKFDLDFWRKDWTSGEAAAKQMTLEQATQEIGKQPDLLMEMLGSCSDNCLRADIEMFGRKASRGAAFVDLVLSHYAAYRMQLFLYLKGAGRDELNTMNLWVGMDAAQPAS